MSLPPPSLLFTVPESPPSSTSASVLLHFDLLHFADIMVFYKPKDCDNTALSKFVGVPGPTIFTNFISLYHNLVIFTIFRMFSFLLCCDHLWSVIFDITIKIVQGCHEWHPYMMSESDRDVSCFPIFVPLLGPSCSLQYNSITIRLSSNPTMVSKDSSERKNCMPLTLHQKLEMIEFSEDSMFKAEIDWNLGLWPKQLTLWMQQENSYRKLLCYSSGAHKW